MRRLTLECTRNLKPATQTRSHTVVSHDLKFPTSNQHLDTRLDVGLTSIRRLKFPTRVVQSAVSVIYHVVSCSQYLNDITIHTYMDVITITIYNSKWVLLRKMRLQKRKIAVCCFLFDRQICQYSIRYNGQKNGNFWHNHFRFISIIIDTKHHNPDKNYIRFFFIYS